MQGSSSYTAHPEVLRAAAAQPEDGPVHIRCPGRDRWIRVGAWERRLLAALTGASIEELTRRFGPEYPGERLQAALDRFAALGLLIGQDTAGPGSHIPSCSPSPPHAPACILIGLVHIGLVAGMLASAILVAAGMHPVPPRPPVLLMLLLAAASALVHEAGHALAGGIVGASVSRLGIGLWAVVPVLRVELRNFWGLGRWERSTIILAGGAVQAMMAAVSFGVWMLQRPSAGGVQSGVFWFGVMSLVLGAVNLLPVHPLDGYWLLAHWLDRPTLYQDSRAVRAGTGVLRAALQVAAGATLVSAAMRMWSR